MRNLAASLTFLAWGLWLGGLASVFIFATRFFAVDYDLGRKAAPVMFLVFEKYQILLAAAALLGTMSWRVLAKSMRVSAIFWLIVIATLPAALGPIFITPKMEALRRAGQSASPEFMKYHGISMSLYSAETLILLVVGAILPWALRGKPMTEEMPKQPAVNQ